MGEDPGASEIRCCCMGSQEDASLRRYNDLACIYAESTVSPSAPGFVDLTLLMTICTLDGMQKIAHVFLSLRTCMSSMNASGMQ